MVEPPSKHFQFSSKLAIFREAKAFEQIISKLSFLSFSLAELEVFSFPSSSTEFSAA